jgi:hypothetical protein
VDVEDEVVEVLDVEVLWLEVVELVLVVEVLRLEVVELVLVVDVLRLELVELVLVVEVLRLEVVELVLVVVVLWLDVVELVVEVEVEDVDAEELVVVVLGGVEELELDVVVEVLRDWVSAPGTWIHCRTTSTRGSPFAPVTGVKVNLHVSTTGPELVSIVCTV